MEKLKLEHLAPYLPYKLKYLDKDTKELTSMRTISTEINMIDFGWGNAHDLSEFKPILRPISDLTKEIEIDGENIIPMNILYSESNKNITTGLSKYAMNQKIILHTVKMPYFIIEKLFEYHFDVFGLIEKGLAIDINTLNK